MKLLFAGVESFTDLAIDVDVDNVLVSAKHMSNNREKIDKILSNFEFIMIDSGAFTYHKKWSKMWKDKIRELYDNPEEKIKDKDWQRRVWMKTDEREELREKWRQKCKKWENEYLEMLETDDRFKADNVVTVEFDVGSQEEKTERRRRFEERGIRVMPVYHPTDDEDYQERLFKRYGVVGIGGLVVGKEGKFEAREFQPVFQRARKYMTKLHGFGMTTQEPMRKMPFYTVDSTSWLMGGKFGTTYEFRNGELKVYDGDKKDIRKEFKERCEEYGVDYEALLDDDYKAVNKWNMIQWKLYEEWLTQSPMKEKQEYWHDKVNGGQLQKEVIENDEGEIEDVVILNSEGEEVDKKAQKEAKLPSVDGRDEMTETEKALMDKVDDGIYMECDSCILGDRCPFYEEGMVCQVPMDKIQGGGDFEEIIEFLFTLQQKRIKIGALQESADGGILDEKLSAEIDRMMNMMKTYKELMQTQDEINIQAKGEGTSVLKDIFGFDEGSDKNDDKNEPIDIN